MTSSRIDSVVAKLIINNLDPNTPQPNDLDCSNCGFCCRGVGPCLTTQEVFSGIYPMSFMEVPADMKALVPDAKWLITMANNPYHGCPWLGEDNRCKHYDLRPLACRLFDCRTATNPPFPAFAKLRFGKCALDEKEKEMNKNAKQNPQNAEKKENV